MSKPIWKRKKWLEFHKFFCTPLHPDPACLICNPPKKKVSNG